MTAFHDGLVHSKDECNTICITFENGLYGKDYGE